MKTQSLLGNLEIAIFCEQTAMIISAGIPAYEGISILLSDAPDKQTKDILQKIYEPLEAGSSFHDALAVSGVFPQYVLDMVELGETSGKLEDILCSLTVYYEREEAIRNSFKSAILYPLVMTGIILISIFLLGTEILPVFHQMYQTLGNDLTGFPFFMMQFSKILSLCMPILFLFLIFLLIAGFFYTKTNAFQKFVQRQPLAMNTASSRFANCMSMAISSGLDTSEGLELAERLSGNPYMKARIQKCKKLVDDGFSFSDAILASKIFNRTYAALLNVGFRTGSLEQVMNRIVKEYEDRIDYELNHIVSRLEPALVIFLSIIIGFILLCFLLPVMGIMMNIG